MYGILPKRTGNPVNSTILDTDEPNTDKEYFPLLQKIQDSGLLPEVLQFLGNNEVFPLAKLNRKFRSSVSCYASENHSRVYPNADNTFEIVRYFEEYGIAFLNNNHFKYLLNIDSEKSRVETFKSYINIIKHQLKVNTAKILQKILQEMKDWLIKLLSVLQNQGDSNFDESLVSKIQNRIHVINFYLEHFDFVQELYQASFWDRKLHRVSNPNNLNENEHKLYQKHLEFQNSRNVNYSIYSELSFFYYIFIDFIESDVFINLCASGLVDMGDVDVEVHKSQALQELDTIRKKYSTGKEYSTPCMDEVFCYYLNLLNPNDKEQIIELLNRIGFPNIGRPRVYNKVPLEFILMRFMFDRKVFGHFCLPLTNPSKVIPQFHETLQNTLFHGLLITGLPSVYNFFMEAAFDCSHGHYGHERVVNFDHATCANLERNPNLLSRFHKLVMPHGCEHLNQENLPFIFELLKNRIFCLWISQEKRLMRHLLKTNSIDVWVNLRDFFFVNVQDRTHLLGPFSLITENLLYFDPRLLEIFKSKVLTDAFKKLFHFARRFIRTREDFEKIYEMVLDKYRDLNYLEVLKKIFELELQSHKPTLTLERIMCISIDPHTIERINRYKENITKYGWSLSEIIDNIGPKVWNPYPRLTELLDDPNYGTPEVRQMLSALQAYPSSLLNHRDFIDLLMTKKAGFSDFYPQEDLTPPPQVTEHGKMILKYAPLIRAGLKTKEEIVSATNNAELIKALDGDLKGALYPPIVKIIK